MAACPAVVDADAAADASGVGQQTPGVHRLPPPCLGDGPAQLMTNATPAARIVIATVVAGAGAGVRPERRSHHRLDFVEFAPCASPSCA